MHITIRRAGSLTLGVAALAVSTGIATAPTAQAAAPVTHAPAGVTLTQEVIGDGVWSPSHDEALAIIPLCQPLKLVAWLNANFSDHGTDIGNFLSTNLPALFRAAFSLDPWATLQVLLTPFVQIPVYAVNDTVFHVPATLGDILSFCASARA